MDMLTTDSEKIKPMRISREYSCILAHKNFKFSTTNRNKTYYIHEIDKVNLRPYTKFLIVMRLLKKAFGGLIYNMLKTKGRNLNRIISFWRRNALAHLQNNGKFSDIIALSPKYFKIIGSKPQNCDRIS